MCRSEEVVLVGGGNSAGHATVFLSGFAKKLLMLVRGRVSQKRCRATSSTGIAGTANIELLCEREVTALVGSPEGRLARVRWKNHAAGEEAERAIRNFRAGRRLAARLRRCTGRQRACEDWL